VKWLTRARGRTQPAVTAPAEPLTHREMTLWVTRAWAMRFFDRIETGDDFGDVVFVGTTLYATNRTQNRVERYSLDTGALLTPIPVGTRPRGLDYVPGRNVLVVANPGSADLSVVDLATATEVRRVPVPPNDQGDVPYSVAAARSGRVLFTTTFGGSGFGARIMQLRWDTGTVRQRTDLGGYDGRTTEVTYLEPSGDRSRIFAAVGDISSGDLWAYDSATDRQSAIGALGDFVGYVAASQDGSTVVTAPDVRVLDGSLGGARDLGRQRFGVAVGSAGQVGYLTRDTGVDFTWLPTGSPLGAVRPLGDTVARALWANYKFTPVGRMDRSPDGNVLAVITDHGITLLPTRR
jgi:hypothetical protein